MKHALPYQREQALLRHHAAADDDSLRRDRQHQLRTQLSHVIGLQFPLSMRSIEMLKLAARPRQDGRARRQAFQTIAVKRTDAAEVPIARVAPRMNVPDLRMLQAMQRPTIAQPAAPDSHTPPYT